MISEALCENEDWNNDAENAAFIYFSNKFEYNRPAVSEETCLMSVMNRIRNGGIYHFSRPESSSAHLGLEFPCKLEA